MLLRLRDAYADTAIVAVVHSIDLARDFDRVIFMEDGRIAASGTAEKLYATDARFRSLWPGADANVPPNALSGTAGAPMPAADADASALGAPARLRLVATAGRRADRPGGV